MDPEIIAKAGEGDEAARAAFDDKRLGEAKKPGGGAHRPSMGQDMMKGRRTEIEYINGLIAEKGAELGIPTPANAALTRIVQEVERGIHKPSPDLIKALRLN